MKRWLLPSIVSVVLTLGALEWVARLGEGVDLVDPRDSLTEMFQPDPELFWSLRPGYRLDDPELNLRWGGEPIEINSLGLRGPEIAMDKPPGVRRIVVLGGSHPMGMWVRRSECYAGVLERLLNDRGQGTWQVLNAAVAGYTSWQGVLQMRTRILRFEPDIVISDLGHNDNLARVPWGLSRSDHEVREPPRIVRLLLDLLHSRSAAYRWSLKRLTEVANREPSMRVTPEEHHEHALEIAELARAGGARTLYMSQWASGVPNIGSSERGESMCLFPEADLDPVVDVCAIFRDRDDLDLLYVDPLHANATGHAMIAQAVLDRLVGLGWVQ